MPLFHMLCMIPPVGESSRLIPVSFTCTNRAYLSVTIFVIQAIKWVLRYARFAIRIYEVGLSALVAGNTIGIIGNIGALRAKN